MDDLTIDEILEIKQRVRWIVKITLIVIVLLSLSIFTYCQTKSNNHLYKNGTVLKSNTKSDDILIKADTSHAMIIDYADGNYLMIQDDYMEWCDTGYAHKKYREINNSKQEVMLISKWEYNLYRTASVAYILHLTSRINCWDRNDSITIKHILPRDLYDKFIDEMCSLKKDRK